MQPNVSALAKKAISAALKGNWNNAIAINEEILQKNSNDLDAKLRLGRAFIQTKQTAKATKLFTQVLKKDPINQVAKRNLDLINKNKGDVGDRNNISAKALIKEPGTTQEAFLEITATDLTSDDFTPGETLKLKLNKKSISVLKLNGGQPKPMGILKQPTIVNRINSVKNKKGQVSAHFIKGRGSKIHILFKCTIPVFRSEKQEVRPYLKKGTIVEPELEVVNQVNTNS